MLYVLVYLFAAYQKYEVTSASYMLQINALMCGFFFEATSPSTVIYGLLKM